MFPLVDSEIFSADPFLELQFYTPKHLHVFTLSSSIALLAVIACVYHISLTDTLHSSLIVSAPNSNETSLTPLFPVSRLNMLDEPLLLPPTLTICGISRALLGLYILVHQSSIYVKRLKIGTDDWFSRSISPHAFLGIFLTTIIILLWFA